MHILYFRTKTCSMSTGLPPLIRNLNLNVNTINEELWDHLFNLYKRLLAAIPNSRRNYWREKIKTFHSKYTKRTDA
jgi:hypothetical protein